MAPLLQVSCPAHRYHAVQSGSQVLVCPTRNVTGDVMPHAPRDHAALIP